MALLYVEYGKGVKVLCMMYIGLGKDSCIRSGAHRIPAAYHSYIGHLLRGHRKATFR